MSQQPTKRRCGVSRTRPFAFSSFGRSVARVAHKRRQPGPHTKDLLESADLGNGSAKNVLKERPLGSESSSEEEDTETVQADFAFFDPKPDDFHGVKLLLPNFLDDKQWDLSGFVDLILGQTTVGTVIKIEDDEDDTPFSIVTALNLGRYKDHKCIMEIKDFMLKVCQKDVIDNLRMLLEEHAHCVGFLVSQRVMNLPPQLLPPLYDGLFDEVSWATEDELSLWSFNFALHTEQLGDQELRNYKLTGLVMAVEADKIPVFRQQLHSLINES